jgi:hypothetical protein
MHFRFAASTAFFLALPMLSSAQQLYFDGSIPVTRQGNTLDLAWAGGINYVHVSAIDIDGDGHQDLFLFDKSGNVPIVLLGDGSPGVGGYRVSRAFDRVHPFPLLHDWALLRDYDCDGLPDIFTYSSAGFAVYRNTSTPGEPSFELKNVQVRSDYVGPSGNAVNANLFISSIDLPAIVDVDGDGDLDILTFSLWGTTLEYHKNLSTELHGTCDSLRYELRNKCWGFFMEDFNNNTVTLDIDCQFNVPNPELGVHDGVWDAEAVAAEGPRAHAGSAVCALDLDGDGVLDLLLGDVGFNNLTAVFNGGSIDLALMEDQDISFPAYDVPVELPIFPVASHVDVDNDGRRDLLVSPNGTSLAQNFQSLWYFRNNGTDAAPVFNLQRTDMFQHRMLEFGEGAYPIPFDHDGDGLMDLLVANHGYFNASGAYQGKVALLRNTGTAVAPAFELVTDDWMNLSTSGIGLSMYPAFADLDGDGDLDMYIGDLQGRMHFFRNTATGPVAQFQLIQPNVTDAGGQVIDVGQFATPIFHDLDGDGRTDLIVGERNGNLNYYRNTGTAQNPAWTLVSESLGGVSTNEYWNVTGHSAPFLFTTPAGERQMLLGSESGWLYHYGGIDGNISGTWTLLDSTYMDRRDGIRTGVCLYDFTGDGLLDLVVGNYRGGLSFWRSDAPTGVEGLDTADRTPRFTAAPNPTDGNLVLTLGTMPGPGSQWVVRNALGQVVATLPAVAERTTLDAAAWPAGSYLVRLEGPAFSATQRVVVVR